MNQEQYVYANIRSIAKNDFINEVKYLLYNGAINQFIYYQDSSFFSILNVDEIIQTTQKVLLLDQPMELYAKINNSFIKIIINLLDEEGHCLKTYPIIPYRTYRDKSEIDWSYYIKLALQFSENFPIYEFGTK